jgi:hypothetical protein
MKKAALTNCRFKSWNWSRKGRDAIQVRGAGDATTEITPGKEFPDPLTDFTVGAYASWEVDIWNKIAPLKKLLFQDT